MLVLGTGGGRTLLVQRGRARGRPLGKSIVRSAWGLQAAIRPACQSAGVFAG